MPLWVAHWCVGSKAWLRDGLQIHFTGVQIPPCAPLIINSQDRFTLGFPILNQDIRVVQPRPSLQHRA